MTFTKTNQLLSDHGNLLVETIESLHRDEVNADTRRIIERISKRYNQAMDNVLGFDLPQQSQDSIAQRESTDHSLIIDSHHEAEKNLTELVAGISYTVSLLRPAVVAHNDRLRTLLTELKARCAIILDLSHK